MSWDASFDEPICLPSGKELRTLRDAGNYITALPVAEHREQKWQTAMNALLMASDGGPTIFARIGMMRAIRPPAKPVYDPKRHHEWRKASRR